jgi:hypothetical protein
VFGSTPKCPVDLQTREWIENRMAWLSTKFGRERLRSVAIVLPNAEFFPDPYDGSDEAVQILFNRVCGYMGVRPDEIVLSLYGEQVPVQHEGNLVPGTGGLYEEGEGRFHIWLNDSTLDDPGGLISTMAHELGHVLLLGQRRISADEPDHEPLTDLLTVFLGLGVITANAVVHESSWISGGWSGWTVGKRGYLTMPMYGYALALFARERSEPSPKWAKLLRADVRQAFEQGQKFLAAAAEDDDLRTARPSLPTASANNDAPATEPLDGSATTETDHVAPHDGVARCAYCNTPLESSGDSDGVCGGCLKSMETNRREMEEEAARADAEYRERSKAARQGLVIFVLLVVALIVWWAW